MTSIKSHLQPQFFLKGFLAPKENPDYADSVFVYKKGMSFQDTGTKTERNPALTGIGNTAFALNFYAFLKDDGTLDAETYEKRLENEIESPCNQVLKKLREIRLSKDEIIKTDEFLSQDERRRLARYIAAMYARTERSRKDHSQAIQKTTFNGETVGLSYQELLKLNISKEDMEKFDRDLFADNPAFDRATGRVTLPPRFLERFANTMETNESFPESIFRAVELVEPVILQMKWQIRITPNQHSFFTGDDPVTWNNLADPNATLLFPISSNTILCGFNNHREPGNIFLEKNPKFVQHIRDVFANRCSEIYYSRQSTWLVDFFNRR